MHQKLVDQAFKKVKKKEVKNSGIPLNDTPTSENLSIILTDQYNASVSDRTLRDVYYGKKNIKKEKTVLALCKFLDYEDYQDFLEKNKKESNVIIDLKGSKSSKSIKISTTLLNLLLNRIQKNKTSITLFCIISFAGVAYFYASTKQRWMIWKDDHYEEVSFDTKKYELGKLKLYKEDRIKYFKKIKVNCEYDFFDESGNPNVWYGKNNFGELEIFTSVGIHPETGKTLKHITEHMIHKYICQ
ncbi:hypothetical protein [Tenacibaculum sp. M341]|uniref:hypothetical protein n=1 Tax=Tenacibaculum sp. M341 TaxID=2530339 RepID=UPI0010504659|nr:hypothetical protein [Tenacibaculum sp. M341]TCI91860.1 hypothetical protein EYW44_09945 [Tenacibaculum sp. M341]